MTSIPQPSKSFELLVARLAPLDRVIAAIMASNGLIGADVANGDHRVLYLAWLL